MQIHGISFADEAVTSLLRRHKVRELSLFGSRARGDDRADSDIDLLVDFTPGSRADLVDLIELKLGLQELFGIKVDLVSREGLKQRSRENIIRDARQVYPN